MELIITGATLLCGDKLQEQSDDALWIRQGMIHKILPASETPSEIPKVDKKGMYLLPGLIDLHVHVMWDGSADPVQTQRQEGYEQMLIRAVANCQEYIRSGITSIRDVGSIEDIALHVAEAIRRKRFTGPRLIACGKTLTMTGGHDPFWARFCDGSAEALKATREQIYKQAQVIKVSATGGVYGREAGELAENSELTYEELKVICDEAHRFGLKVASHAIGREGIYNSIAAGVDTIEHGHYLDDELVEKMIEQGIAWVPTLYVYQQIAQEQGIPAYAQEKAKRIIALHEQVFVRYFNSGIMIGAGSDAGSCFTPHPALVDELLTMNRFVPDKREILKTATVNAGQILGLPVGQITEGYHADLILLRKNPLDDLAALHEVAEVYLGGEQVK